MKRLIVSALVVLLIGCTSKVPPDPAIKQLRDENAALQIRLLKVEKELIETDRKNVAEDEALRQAFARIRELEGRLGLAEQPVFTSPAVAPTSELTSASRSGSSALSPPSSGIGTYSTPSRESSASSAPAESSRRYSQGQVAKANDFFNAQKIAEAKCRVEWPSDFHMQNYCLEQQMTAAAALADYNSRPFGVTQDVAGQVRAKCAEEWPNDFHMRQYCENQQFTAYQAQGRH